VRPLTNVRARPGDERGFVHKKLLRVIGGVAGALPIPGASVISGLARKFAGGGAPPVPTFPQTFPSSVPISSVIPGGPGGPCSPGTVMSPSGFCVAPTSSFGVSQLSGNAILGRFGPAMVPGSVLRDIATCDRGMVLGKDGLCYDHLPNRDRLYPRGRRPLLTGGDMKAISRARRAGNRLATVKSDLVAIGMLKPAGTRKRKKKAVPTC